MPFTITHDVGGAMGRMAYAAGQGQKREYDEQVARQEVARRDNLDLQYAGLQQRSESANAQLLMRQRAQNDAMERYTGEQQQRAVQAQMNRMAQREIANNRAISAQQLLQAKTVAEAVNIATKPMTYPANEGLSQENQLVRDKAVVAIHRAANNPELTPEMRMQIITAKGQEIRDLPTERKMTEQDRWEENSVEITTRGGAKIRVPVDAKGIPDMSRIRNAESLEAKEAEARMKADADAKADKEKADKERQAVWDAGFIWATNDLNKNMDEPTEEAIRKKMNMYFKMTGHPEFIVGPKATIIPDSPAPPNADPEGTVYLEGFDKAKADEKAAQERRSKQTELERLEQEYLK